MRPMQAASAVYKVLRWQAVIGCVVALAGFLVFGAVVGASVLLGAAIAVIANFNFARIVLARKRQHDAVLVARGFFTGESVKLLVTVALFGLTFKLFGEHKIALSPLAVFTGYVATLLAYWYALWRRV